MKIMKMKLLLLVLFLFISTQLTFSQTDTKSFTPKKFFIAKMDFGIFAKDIKPVKIDAAMNFTAMASRGKYYYIPFTYLDSVYQHALKKHDTLTSMQLAKETYADFYVFVRVNKLQNILRVDMSAINIKDTNDKKFGLGYAAIRYRKLTDRKQMIDPALSTAMMRAFAQTMGNDSLFVFNDSISVKPVPTLVIGGINYIDDEAQKKWEIFLTKEISSYDAVINIFDEIKDSPDFVVYDIETRDSLYSFFNMLVVENYKSSTTTELKTLFNMDVGYFITGILTRDENGAILDLNFCRILKDGKLAILEKATNLVKEDSIAEFKSVIRKTVRKLMDKKPWLKPNLH